MAPPYTKLVQGHEAVLGSEQTTMIKLPVKTLQHAFVHYDEPINLVNLVRKVKGFLWLERSCST